LFTPGEVKLQKGTATQKCAMKGCRKAKELRQKTLQLKLKDTMFPPQINHRVKPALITVIKIYAGKTSEDDMTGMLRHERGLGKNSFPVLAANM
jgi:hypothetical protein